MKLDKKLTPEEKTCETCHHWSYEHVRCPLQGRTLCQVELKNMWSPKYGVLKAEIERLEQENQMSNYDIAKSICDSCHSVLINLNDVFTPAADSYEICTINLEKILSVIEQYGPDALLAYVAVAEGVETQPRQWDIRSTRNNQNFLYAKKRILEIKDKLLFCFDNEE